MADEKKPKIDLKARLGKTAVGGQAPPPAAGIPVPAPAPTPAASGGNMAPVVAPASAPNPGGLPVPPGMPVGPPPGFSKPPGGTPLDPSNPLAAAVAPPYRAPATPPPPPQPQRIEVDELAVQEARKGARKQGLAAGMIFGVVVGVVGFIAGGAQETSKARATSVGHAKALAGDVTKAREQLKVMADKVEAGRKMLIQDKKFPDALAKDLTANIDFDGSKLAGVRFSGYPAETTTGLVEFITAVQQLNDRKTAVGGLLTRLQKPINDQLTAGTKTTITYAVFIGEKDPAKNSFALLAPLTKPIEAPNPAAINLPAEFTGTNPLTRSNISAPKYTTGGLEKGAAFYVLPKSIDAACPSETSGQIAQLVGQLSRVINDIRGEKGAAGNELVTDDKPGLLDRADKLITGLNKVQ